MDCHCMREPVCESEIKVLYLNPRQRIFRVVRGVCSPCKPCDAGLSRGSSEHHNTPGASL